MGRLKPWYEWEMPPLWVCALTGLVLVGLATGVCWKISDSMIAGARATAAPATAPARNPNDPDSF